jgi:hypothetical protein
MHPSFINGKIDHYPAFSRSGGLSFLACCFAGAPSCSIILRAVSPRCADRSLGPAKSLVVVEGYQVRKVLCRLGISWSPTLRKEAFI